MRAVKQADLPAMKCGVPFFHGDEGAPAGGRNCPPRLERGLDHRAVALELRDLGPQLTGPAIGVGRRSLT